MHVHLDLVSYSMERATQKLHFCLCANFLILISSVGNKPEFPCSR